MTYGLELFSDAPPASMPMTATITTTLSGLLACSLAMIQDRATVLRIVLFALIMGLCATTAQAGIVERVVDSSFCGGGGAALVGSPYPPTPTTADYPVRGPGSTGGLPNGAPFMRGQGQTTVNGVYRNYQDWAQNYSSPTGQRVCRFIEGPSQCGEKADTDGGVMNLGVGYAKTTANTDDWIEPKFHTTACNQGCQVTVGAVQTGSCYVSGIVGPPYPGYCEFATTYTGDTCTASDEAADDTLPAIPCPTGMAPGTVNGARGCYKVTDVTKETTTTQNPDGTTTTTETTTGPNGTTTTTTTCTGDGACSTTIQHIGGGAGTGAPSETGQDYDGSSEGEEEGEGACGKEGLPDCKVKVNEDGTPQEVGGMQGTLDGVLQGVEQQFDYLGGMGWVREDLPFVWNPSLPSGSCAAVEIHGQAIDICDPLGKARMVWAYVLAFMAGLYVWRSATEVMKGS